ncbi:FtsX-like permease family protein [Candidatus Parcubacteria bacterium]|nr:MAG: FtsX-like permease family protein [Candidatus Parcubacteria bacterium]
MRFVDTVKTASAGLRHAKVRSLLTILGIVIGIASVMLLMSIGTSAERLIVDQVERFGSNLISIQPGGSSSSRFSPPPAVLGIVIKTLNERDLDTIRREPSVAGVSAEVRGSARVIFENNDLATTYIGVTGEYFDIINLEFESGGRFTPFDDDSAAPVAILGPGLADELFGERNPIGKTIRIKDKTFRVVGVISAEGLGLLGSAMSDMVLIPMSVAQKQLLGINYYNEIAVKAADGYDVEFVKSRIISLLRQNHRITDPDKDDFTVRTQAEALDLLGTVTSVLTLFLTAIASISLIVGGIGVMNIMLVSVVERTREIGLRKAVGATNRDILMQFLVEAIMLSIVGGIAGIALGALLAAGVYVAVTQFSTFDWAFAMPASAILSAVLVASVTGIIFGLYPARRAAQKAPIEALRYE